MTIALLLLAAAAALAARPAHPGRLPGLARPRRRPRPGIAARAGRWAARLRGLAGEPAPDGARLLDAARTLELLAACLRAGLPPATAAAAVAAATGDRPLAAVAARLALGAEDPWAALAEAGDYAGVAALARRSADSGGALAAGLEELAARHRGRAADRAEAAAERAGVLIAGPLALCFLPAFVALGLIPVVAGLAAPMLGGAP